MQREGPVGSWRDRTPAMEAGRPRMGKETAEGADAFSGHGSHALLKASAPASNVEQALNEANEAIDQVVQQMDETDKTIHMLSARISPALLPESQVGSGICGEELKGASLDRQESELRARILNLTARISNLAAMTQSQRAAIDNIYQRVDL